MMHCMAWHIVFFKNPWRAWDNLGKIPTSKLLLNLLVQISKALTNSKIQLKFQKNSYPWIRPIGQPACVTHVASRPTRVTPPPPFFHLGPPRESPPPHAPQCHGGNPQRSTPPSFPLFILPPRLLRARYWFSFNGDNSPSLTCRPQSPCTTLRPL
jgi:hypothetical protein